MLSFVDKIRTVSETKRDFYQQHTRPIDSIYRRVVEELMVEMHLLSVNTDFHPDPIYYLGVVTSFDRFMQGYPVANDRESIFNALCRSVGGNPEEYRREAENLRNFAARTSADELLAWLVAPSYKEGAEKLLETVQTIANSPNYKYSRLLAIGLYTILETADPQLLKDTEQRERVLKQIVDALHLPEDKTKRDLDIYRGNLDKMEQLLAVLQDALEANRKQRERREQEKTTS
jgi:photosystem II biogenesis protein Psp29